MRDFSSLTQWLNLIKLTYSIIVSIISTNISITIKSSGWVYTKYTKETLLKQLFHYLTLMECHSVVTILWFSCNEDNYTYCWWLKIIGVARVLVASAQSRYRLGKGVQPCMCIILWYRYRDSRHSKKIQSYLLRQLIIHYITWFSLQCSHKTLIYYFRLHVYRGLFKSS